MSTIILGAGVIGSTLAYYLAKKGEKVTILERQASAGLETSFANAGQISYGYSSPWAAPSIPLKAIGWLFQRHAPLSIKPDFTLFQLEWIIKFLKNCRYRPYAVNKERMLRLAEYSKNCLHTLRQELDINYDGQSLGTLQLFRSDKQLDIVVAKDLPVLKQNGIAHTILSASEISKIEPALEAMQYKFAGGLHLPNDETGDCHMFTQSIFKKAVEYGANFHFNVEVEKLLLKYTENKKKVYGVATKNKEFMGSNVVVALGSYSRELLKGLVNIPVYPIKGYSITADIINQDMAPRSTILDETYKVAITRLGDRIRVGGMANITGFNKHIDVSKIDALNFVLHNLFPNAYKESIGGWAGLRPATPDGTPIVGASEVENLWLSTGHGTLGWTMACGSAKLLSDLILGIQPEIKHDDLNNSRYKN
jgi:D-amino-acid dehydrogenase